MNSNVPIPFRRNQEKKKPSAAETPPCSIEREREVLGCILIHDKWMDEAISILKPESFYNHAHRDIYQAMLDLHSDNKPVDLITVCELLRSRDQLEKMGGVFLLQGFVDGLASTANFKAYAKIVEEKRILRDIFNLSLETYFGVAGAEDASEYHTRFMERIFGIETIAENRRSTAVKDGLIEIFKEIEDITMNKKTFSGAPTGLQEYDELTGGLQKKEITFLAGRPGMGKTALALNISTSVAASGAGPVFIFSMEMSKDRIQKRLLALIGRIRQSIFKFGNPNEREQASLIEAIKKLSALPIEIDDRDALTVVEIRAAIRQAMQKYGRAPALIVVDYIQRMKVDLGKNGTREQEVSSFSSGLTQIAKEFDCHVLALAQLNRSLEKRPDRRPIMSDLRESGQMEQDADTILFVYRDEVYDEDTVDQGIAELIIGKQRSGMASTVRARFQAPYGIFEDVY